MVSFPLFDIFIYNIILENFFMKNLVALHEPEMLFEYVGRIWRSPIFQASHQDPNGYIHRLIRQFSEQPEPRNTIEQMISQYTVSSLKWAQIWKNS